MEIALVGDSPLAAELAARLGGTHALRRLDRLPRDTEPLAPWLEGAEVLVHAGAWCPGTDPQEALDIAGRRTYDLCRHAAGAGIPRLVYVGTLDLFRTTSPTAIMSEEWQPIPPADLEPLCLYLGEITCRDHAEFGTFEGVGLRLGPVLADGESASAPGAVHIRDAAHAVELALTAELSHRSRWWPIHVTGPEVEPRFPLHRAARWLGYQPEIAVLAQGEGQGRG